MRRLLLLFLALGACAPRPTLYQWGRYEELLAESYRAGHPSNRAAEQLPELLELLARSEAEGRRPAPGLTAHVGYLYAALGDRAAAQRYFAAEKARYPEAGPFMDLLVERMGGGGVRTATSTLGGQTATTTSTVQTATTSDAPGDRPR